MASSDCAPVLVALGASVRLRSARGERRLPVAALYRDDGIDFLAKSEDEILVEVIVPAAADARRCRSAFRKLRRRGAIDFSVLTVAAAVWRGPGDRIERSAVVLGAVASHPLAVTAAAAALDAGGACPSSAATAARLCREAATPLDNTDFAPQWRSRMVERQVHDALVECFG